MLRTEKIVAGLAMGLAMLAPVTARADYFSPDWITVNVSPATVIEPVTTLALALAGML